MKKIILAVFLLLSIMLTFAQDDFDTWKKNQENQRENFKNANDKAFKSFLEKNWQAFKTYKGIVPDKKPKPKELPIAKAPKEKEADNSPIVEIPPIVPQKPQEPLVEEKPKPEIEKPIVKPENLIKFNFYGRVCSIDYKAKIDLPNSIDNKAIASAFENLSNSDYQKAIEELQSDKKQMKLNDYTYLMFLQKAAKEIFSDKRKAVLFTWFALIKSGYAAKIGYSGDNIYLLIPSKQILYLTAYLKIDGKNYFVISEDESDEDIYTYKESYPNAEKFVNLFFKDEMEITKENENKILTFTYFGQDYKVYSSYNKSSIELFADYPQTDMNVYFSFSLPEDSKVKLLNSLRKIIDGKSETEAVNILLAFVQKAFKYETDGEQFGKEKTFFPEELFYYPYSDCEDRSVMFAYLVKNLLNLKVIGLEYPGHLTTAVKFSKSIYGKDGFVFKGEKYIICDPTYINAQFGMCMPQFKNVKPKVLVK